MLSYLRSKHSKGSKGSRESRRRHRSSSKHHSSRDRSNRRHGQREERDRRTREERLAQQDDMVQEAKELTLHERRKEMVGYGARYRLGTVRNRSARVRKQGGHCLL